MTSVAFLGLGHMGAPMASRLLAAGHQLTVWNRTPSKAAAAAARQQAALADGLGRRDLAAVIPHVRGRTATSGAALEEVAR